jgi:hypothetical protein
MAEVVPSIYGYKRVVMSDETGREPVSAPCRYCGHDAPVRDSEEQEGPSDGTDVYQVIVLCAACRRPFATIARN